MEGGGKGPGAGMPGRHDVEFRRLRRRVAQPAGPLTILDDVSGVCRTGRLLAIMGASGSGKTSTVRPGPSGVLHPRPGARSRRPDLGRPAPPASCTAVGGGGLAIGPRGGPGPGPGSLRSSQEAGGGSLRGRRFLALQRGASLPGWQLITGR